MTDRMTHSVPHTKVAPPLDGAWDSETWRHVAPLGVSHFHPRSSATHRPRVQAKLLHADRTLHVLFRVQDRFVRAACTRYGQIVCKDSCVEIFLQPKPDAGYFNFEVNCGGTMLLWYVRDITLTPEGRFKDFTEVPAELAASVGIYHSMPAHVPEEIPEPREWFIQLAIPARLLETFVGSIGELRGEEWRANLFKCADATSHPHWASWNPIGEELNFHQPRYFGTLRFE
jgi:hypothetical protein